MMTTLAVAMAAALAAAPDKPALVRDGGDEVLYLDGLADPNRWGPSECTVAASRDLRAAGRATVHMHIPVDHHAGEARYPIGWPRMYLKLKKPAETGWADFERFEFLVLARMSRDRPPRQVIGLQIHCPDRPHVFSRNLAATSAGNSG